MRCLDDYLNYLTIDKSLRKITIDIYRRDILEFQKYIGSRKSIKKATRAHIREFLCFLAEKKNQPITRRRKITSLKNFFKYLKDESKIENNPVDLISMPKILYKEPVCLSGNETREVLNCIKKDEVRFSERNYLMIRILAETGIRLNELTSLGVSDVSIDNLTVRVIRKGGSQQEIPINIELGMLIEKQIENKKKNEPVFISSHKRRITNRRVGLMFQKYVKKTGIKKDNISAHSLRHGFCSRLLDKGVNIKVIQVLAGHKSITTTEKYLHIAKAKLRKEVRLAMI